MLDCCASAVGHGVVFPSIINGSSIYSSNFHVICCSLIGPGRKHLHKFAALKCGSQFFSFLTPPMGKASDTQSLSVRDNRTGKTYTIPYDIPVAPILVVL